MKSLDRKSRLQNKPRIQKNADGNVRSLTRALFFDDDLYSLEKKSGLPVRLIWLSLICSADRYGRFLWSRSSFQTLLIEDMSVIDACVDALYHSGLLLKYKVGGESFGYIVGYWRHQSINCRELAMDVPHPDVSSIVECNPQLLDDYAESLARIGEPVLFKAKRKPRASKVELVVAQVAPAVPVNEDSKGNSYEEASEYQDKQGSLINEDMFAKSEFKPAKKNSTALQMAPGYSKIPGGAIVRKNEFDTLSTVVLDETDVSPSIAIMKLNGPINELGFSEKMARSFDLAYPGADNVMRIRQAAQWLNANPERRKTAKGLMRFINSWVGRAADNGTGLLVATHDVQSRPGSMTSRFSTDRRVGVALDAINNMLNERVSHE